MHSVRTEKSCDDFDEDSNPETGSNHPMLAVHLEENNSDDTLQTPCGGPSTLGLSKILRAESWHILENIFTRVVHFTLMRETCIDPIPLCFQWSETCEAPKHVSMSGFSFFFQRC